jgi:hypothetical protein
MVLSWLIGDHVRRFAACANCLVQSLGVVLVCLANVPAMVLGSCMLFGLATLCRFRLSLRRKSFRRQTLERLCRSR